MFQRRMTSPGETLPSVPSLHERNVLCKPSGLVEVGQILPTSEGMSFRLGETYQLALVEPNLVGIEAEELLARAIVERGCDNRHRIGQTYRLRTWHRHLDPDDARTAHSH